MAKQGKDNKKEVLNYLQEMENKFKDEKARLLEEKRELQKQVRDLTKKLEVHENTNALNLEMKSNEIEMIKSIVGGKVKDWEKNYRKLELERDTLKAKVEELEGNIKITRRDGSQRLDMLQKEKENIIQELNKEHEQALTRHGEKLEKAKQQELEKEITDIKAKLEKETREIIERQKKLWEDELKIKENELINQQKKWQDEFETKRIELEKREKEYLQDLLDKFKKS